MADQSGEEIARFVVSDHFRSSNERSHLLPVSTRPTALLLRRQLKELQKGKGGDGFSAGLIGDNIYEWQVTIVGPSDTMLEGGLFRAKLSFPKTYPMQPPTMTFLTEMWHPNIYPDGKVCISILHPPEEDQYGYEKASERWLPIHTVETILVSVISLLSSPNDDSPANVDAAKQWREDLKGYKRKVRRLVEKSMDQEWDD
ncbi:ubiquitin-conjugating enzyme E2 G1 [Gonapodya sp. JEL0774]|nr:ubiquitin-conjugating enzyme E2 G1 [Gonapodya sp. JEL0774]